MNSRGTFLKLDQGGWKPRTKALPVGALENKQIVAVNSVSDWLSTELKGNIPLIPYIPIPAPGTWILVLDESDPIFMDIFVPFWGQDDTFKINIQRHFAADIESIEIVFVNNSNDAISAIAEIESRSQITMPNAVGRVSLSTNRKIKNYLGILSKNEKKQMQIM